MSDKKRNRADKTVGQNMFFILIYNISDYRSNGCDKPIIMIKYRFTGTIDFRTTYCKVNAITQSSFIAK